MEASVGKVHPVSVLIYLSCLLLMTILSMNRIPNKDYDALGLSIPKSVNVTEDGDEEEADTDEGHGDNNDLDEVLGFHFMNSSRLYIAYVYVCSAAKVFEGRLAVTSLPEAAPDFEAVYHLVIDAVDYYNETWERECKAQQEVSSHPFSSHFYFLLT